VCIYIDVSLVTLIRSRLGAYEKFGDRLIELTMGVRAAQSVSEPLS
jgi:hypothetical protein